MNILVVGNGFDLAHNLPTRYSDFLDFMVLCIKEWGDWRKKTNYRDNDDATVLNDLVNNVKANKKVYDIFEENKASIEQDFKQDGTLSFAYENTWIRYFLYVYSYKKSFEKEFNWIDIEAEMLNFIRHIDSQNYTSSYINFMSMYLPYYQNDNFTSIHFKIRSVGKSLKKLAIPEEALQRKIFECLFTELEQFSELLKFYLELVMQNFYKKPNMIFNINREGFGSIYIDRILSFNYTNTHIVYNRDVSVHYINGRLANTKIILGIENPDLNKTISYCDNGVSLFFKNVQRILYNYKYTYTNWINGDDKFINVGKVLKNGEIVNGLSVYIIGHSLAVSDKNILTDVIMNADNVYIYYYNEQDKQDKIMSLYKLLGDEVFSNHVNNDNAKPSISFVSQDKITLSKTISKSSNLCYNNPQQNKIEVT